MDIYNLEQLELRRNKSRTITQDQENTSRLIISKESNDSKKRVSLVNHGYVARKIEEQRQTIV